MRSTISIELGGTTFVVDEGAYRALRSYLDRAGDRLGSHPDRSEVLDGLERSIAAELRQRVLAPGASIDEAAMLAALAVQRPRRRPHSVRLHSGHDLHRRNGGDRLRRAHDRDAAGLTQLMSRSRRVLATALCAVALTSGCDNAVEHLAVEEWREVGTASAPSTDVRYTVTTLTPGAGRVVLPGEIVQLRIVSSNGSEREVVVWTGARTTANPPLVLGTDELRAALIGRRVGERFAIGLAGGFAWLPMYGAMSTLEFPGLSFSYVEDGVRIRAREWPRVDLARAAGQAGNAELEVLDACPARLLQRTATLRQWGHVVELSAARVAPRREGTLHWLEFDAACAEGARRLRIGPLYDERGSVGGQGLYGWEASYVALRPPARFPAEWELTPLR